MVEVMVVVVIIGLLSAFTVPKFIQITGENQLDGDANALFQDILWMRTASIKTGNPYVLSPKTTAVGGQSIISWEIHEMKPDANKKYTKNLVRPAEFAGVAVKFGKPDEISDPTSTQIPLVTNFSAYSDGYRDPATTITNCKQPVGDGTTSTTTAEKWSDGITACGGAVGDMEGGAIFISSSRSKARAYMIGFDRTKSMTPRLYRYMGNAWGAM